MSHSTQNSKSILARALAEENLKVIHDPSINTAMFDVANRTLMLPVWENISSECYDLLVGHEVGHALYTPDIDAGKDADCTTGPWTSIAEEIGGNVHASYVQGLLNIVEDVRIERKVKQKYPGLRRDFAVGYREMFEKNFFATEDKDVSKMSFGDRLNLHFKIGTHLPIQFSEDEQRIVDAVENCESFNDTCDITRQIFDFIGGKRQHIEIPKQNGGAANSNNNGNSPKDAQGDGQGKDQGENKTDNLNSSSSNKGENESKNQSQTSQNDSKNNNNSSSVGGGSAASQFTPMTTQNAFDQHTQQATSKKITHTKYYTIPNANEKNIILPYSKTNEFMSSYFASIANTNSGKMLMNAVNTKFNDLINKTRPLVTQMIQQFEMKKAADEQKRTTTARSGKLDCDRLCLHKITDDIFLNYTNVADGKNHGMVMFVDWSSSMQNQTEDVIAQVIMLSTFCKRVGIPFDVYLFSSNWEIFEHMNHKVDLKSQFTGGTRAKFFSRSKNQYTSYYDDDSNFDGTNHSDYFSLIHVLSSEMRGNQFNEAIKNLFVLGQSVSCRNFSNSDGHPIPVSLYPPNGFHQGGTPLDSTVMAAMKIVPDFQKKHKVQIVNTIFLTDGDTGYAPFYCNGYANEMVFVRSQLNDKEYNISKYCTSTDALLHIFGDVTGSTTIGFFITAPRGYCRYLTNNGYNPQATGKSRYAMPSDLTDKGYVEADRMRVVNQYDHATGSYKETVTDTFNHGYDRLFLLPSSNGNLNEDVGDMLDNLPTNATLTKIRNTFFKAVGKRTNSRNFINRFSDVIAQPIKR